MKQLSIIRVRKSEYEERIKALKRQVREYEQAGDYHRAEISRDMLDSYESTGNSLLPVGSIKLEIIEE